MNRTLQDIKNSTSLDNLKKAKPAGQIATLLILIIAAMLIFVLTMANIGQVSNYATVLSNAADSASLFFASQIGTKSYQLSQALLRSCHRPTKCCVKTGLLSTILAIILAVIAAVLCLVFGVGLLLITVICALAGAAGGAIGGAIAGTGAAQGAIQGAMIGAAIGAGCGAGSAVGGAIALELGAVLYATVEAAAIIGATIGATLAIASNIYTAYVKDAMRGDAMAAAAKALNGLPETQRIRESIFLQALISTIDDPNKVADVNDSDGDGDTTELVPNFQYCWDKRIADLKAGNASNLSQAEQAIERFLIGDNSAVGNFLSAINNFVSHLARQEVEGNDGTVTLLLRALENAGYPVSFWEPGPSAAQLSAWKTWDPNECPECEPPNPPAGYDELDYVIDELASDFPPEVNEIRNQAMTNLVYNWRQWVPWFYDPNPSEGEGAADDYYHSLYGLINGDSSLNPVRIGLNGWVNEIERIRQGLPLCVYGSNQYDSEGNLLGCFNYINSTDCIHNPPCRWHPSNPNFGTIDDDFDDEFQALKDAVNQFIPAVEQFRQACANFYNEMASLESQGQLTVSGCGLSGINPVTYSWTDSRGSHSVTVRLGDYNMPRLVKKSYGNWLIGKKCTELIYWQQNLNVAIERQDPSNVTVGILGRWNPSYSGKIRRSSTAQYLGWATGGYVKIVGR